MASTISLLAFVAFIVSLPWTAAVADDLIVSLDTNQTTAVDTASGDGNGPGNIVIDGTGAVELTSGIPVTINSDHSLTNLGLIETETESDATVVLVDLNAADVLSSNILNTGRITVLGPVDGSPVFNTPVENAGIRVVGSGILTGTIDNALGGSVEVGGNASVGILIDGDMIGNLFNAGTVTTIGVEATSVGVYGDMVGNIVNFGNIGSSGRDGIGLYVGGTLTGTITNSGTIGVGRNATRDFEGKIINEVFGDAAIWIAGPVTGGIQIIGNRVTEADELTLAFDDPAQSIRDSEVTAIGSGQAIRIAPGGSSGNLANVIVGVIGSDNNAVAILNQGLINTGSITEGINAEAITIEGLVVGGTVYTAVLNGGIRNDGGDIRAGTIDGSSTAIRIGDNGSVPAIFNTGEILSLTNDSTEDVSNNVIGDLGGDSFAILVEQGGTLTSVTNSGRIKANAAGSGSSAGAIIVRSGTLTSFSNSGDIEAIIRDGSTGTSTALDVRTSTSDISFLNSGTMIGDIFLGDGSDTFTATGGTITGNISLAGGNDIITLTDTTVAGSFFFTTGTKLVTVTRTTLNGGFSEAGANIDLSITDSDWTITSDEAATLRTLDVQGTSTLRIEVDGVNNRAGTILTTGTATLSDATTIIPLLTSVITDQQTFTLVRAGQLNSNLTFSQVSTAETSYMHNTAVVRDPNDQNVIFLQVTRRSAEDLGLIANTAAYYESSSAALSQDSALFAELASITAQAEFESALDQFLPDTSDAIIQSAIDQQNMAFGAINRRLDRVPALGFYRDRPTVWLQTMGHYAKRNAAGERSGYTTWSGGIAIGADRQINEITRAGLAYTQLWSFPDELASFDKPTEFSSSQLNGYFRMGNAHKHLQGALSFGYDSFKSERRTIFGSEDRTTLGDWNGYEFGGAMQLALGVKRGGFSFVPTARLNYLYFQQGSYIETGGGNGLNLDVPSNNTDSLRAGLGLAARQDFLLEDESLLQLEVRSNYTREFMTGTGNINLAFAAGGAPFILESAALTQNVFSLGFGLFYKNDHATISFDYDGEKASNYTAHTSTVTVRFRF